jgi:two-component system response regulator (stage 0 sporulation protein A)
LLFKSALSSYSPSAQNPRKCPFKRCFRAITRDAIEVAWNRGRLDVTNQLLGVTLFNERDKPTNGEFISLIAEKASGE